MRVLRFDVQHLHERLGIEREVSRVGAKVPLGINRGGEALELVRLERAEVVGTDSRGRRRLLEGEATLAAPGSKDLAQSHSRPSRSSKSSTSGRFIRTSRDFEPWYAPTTWCSASWSTMRPALE